MERLKFLRRHQMKIKNTKNRGGFSLTEVLVAVLVLTMAVVSASNFLVSMMRSNAMNTSVLQAYYYSVEGLEAFRNMRDTYFMNYLDFCGEGDDQGEGVFGLKGGFCEEKKYAVDVNPFYGSNDAAIWKLTRNSGDDAGFIDQGTEALKTFRRICEVEEITPDKELQITCTTTYDDNGKTGDVALKTILTNWKQ